MLTDYKTTIFGIIAALASFIAFAPDVFNAAPWVQRLAAFIMAGGLAGMGITAKQVGKGSDLPTDVVDAKLSSVAPAVGQYPPEEWPPIRGPIPKAPPPPRKP